MFAAIGRSIRLRVMFLMIAVTFSALLFAAVALVLYDLGVYRQYWTDDMVTQARLVGRASEPAVAFDDSLAAVKNLALLQERERVLSGAIYTRRGTLFASYTRPGGHASPIPAAVEGDGYRIAMGRAIINQGIYDATGRIGTIRIEARYDLARRFQTYLVIILFVMVGSLLLAAVMSLRLQSAVTQPLLAITDVSRQVKAGQDFSLRVRRTTNDETGELVDTFNDMLREVGQRTEALERTNRSLEREMHVRQDAEQALRAADQKKDEFLATLAHELRNPLAPLRNALEILRRTPENGGAAAGAREIMDRQLRQLVRLVDDLLEVSRITTGKLTLKRERVEFGAVIESALDMARPYLEARGVRFTESLPRERVLLDADATRLSQVFLNLLHNAAKFTDRGGKVSLAARVDDGHLVVTVEDTGIGIPPEMLPVIFDMFAQLDRSLDRVHAGLGVGLSLARTFVELHGGTLQAESEGIGRGSRFTVRLPVARDPVGAPTALPAADESDPGSPRKILVVDDNVDFVETFAMLLRDRGHEVHTAKDGEEALRAVENVRPQVAFLDIGLPKIDGYTLARRIRALPGLEGIVLIAVTGWGQERDRRLAEEAGFDYHMVKPIEPRRVDALLDSIAEGRAVRGG